MSERLPTARASRCLMVLLLVAAASADPGRSEAQMDDHVKADRAYPGVEIIPDGGLVTTTYGHWTPDEEPCVVRVRLTLAELDARASKP